MKLSLIPILFVCIAASAQTDGWKFPCPQNEIARYTAQRAAGPITVDGKLDEPSWKSAAVSPRFVDILTGGPVIHDTRAAVLWDDQYLYVSYRVEEPFVHATFTNHNDLIYQGNDVECFIAGPDAYYELEINAFATCYEVFFAWKDTFEKSGLAKHPEFQDARLVPFNGVGFTTHPRGGRVGNFDHAMPGLKVAVHIDGTVNDDSDRDRGWTVEMALPWQSLKWLATDGRSLPPKNGDIWRMDFSRFNTYKEAPPAKDSGGWFWTRHGVWDSHVPECFAYITLSTNAVVVDAPRAELQRTTETPEQYTQRMKWFGEARFGMFIHWGVYAVPAGEYGGQTRYGEWIMESAKIPASKYEQYAAEFNPVKFNAREWVGLAKEAGMKYLVITSKHHDGFGLWDSKLTDWDLGRTPFKRDPLKELAEACQAEGITFCLYHSIMDWHHPDYLNRRAWNDTATGTPDMNRYMAYLKGQLKELITGYGPLGILWFDGEWENAWTPERGIELYNFVRTLQPSIIVNNRVGRAPPGMAGLKKGQGVGDYGTPEQEIPPTGFGQGVYWESCMTMNRHWGYNKRDDRWKSTRQLVRNLIDCASKGGNYLLNVGPTAEGLIPDPSIERLRAVGQWTKSNAEAIYGTEASPFRKLPWGRCTQRTDDQQTTLYLHVFDWPADGQLLVPGLINQPGLAKLLVGGKELAAKKTKEGVVLELPQPAPDEISSTIALTIPGKAEVTEARVTPGKDGSLLLEPVDAELLGQQIRTENPNGKPDIGSWSEATDSARWPITVTEPGEYEVSAELAGEAVGNFTVEVSDQKLTASSPDTKSYSKFEVKALGVVKLAPGNHTLAVRPVAEKWQPMNLRYILLTPKK